MESEINRLYRACQLDPENKELQERLKAVAFRANNPDYLLFLFGGQLKLIEDYILLKKGELRIYLAKTKSEAFLLFNQKNKFVKDWSKAHSYPQCKKNIVGKRNLYFAKWVTKYGWGGGYVEKEGLDKVWKKGQPYNKKLDKYLKRYGLQKRKDHDLKFEISEPISSWSTKTRRNDTKKLLILTHNAWIDALGGHPLSLREKISAVIQASPYQYIFGNQLFLKTLESIGAIEIPFEGYESFKYLKHRGYS